MPLYAASRNGSVRNIWVKIMRHWRHCTVTYSYCDEWLKCSDNGRLSDSPRQRRLILIPRLAFADALCRSACMRQGAMMRVAALCICRVSLSASSLHVDLEIASRAWPYACLRSALLHENVPTRSVSCASCPAGCSLGRSACVSRRQSLSACAARNVILRTRGTEASSRRVPRCALCIHFTTARRLCSA